MLGSIYGVHKVSCRNFGRGKNASRYLPAVPQKIIENIRGPLDPDNSPRHVDETRRYIQDFNRLDEETTSARELYDRMLALYPDRINPDRSIKCEPLVVTIDLSDIKLR
jgi:hypothetical protein